MQNVIKTDNHIVIIDCVYITLRRERKKMNSVSVSMQRVIEKCDICLRGQVISKELLMRTFSQFLSETIEKDKHNINIVLHTGSVCFDAVLLSYIAISDILYNEMDSVELVHSLSRGDLVIYGKQRYIFRGFINEINGDIDFSNILDDGDNVLLEQSNCKTIVRKNGWGNILPYQGKSKRLDGRGLRKDNGLRKSFFKTVLGMNEEDIPRTIDVSTVVVMPKNYAIDLIQGLSFRFDGLHMQYTDLVNVSYYTERGQEYPLGGNVAKVEPVIKITSKVSVARKLLFQRRGNRNIGLVVLGSEILQKGHSELPELIERRSIQYKYLCMNNDYDDINSLLLNYENANLFACTKDFLLSYSKENIETNSLTEQLSKQVDAVIDHEITDLVITKIIGWEKYKRYKQSIYRIKASDYDSEEKNEFIIQAFSLMNLFMTAVFPIKELEERISHGEIDNVVSPKIRIEKLSDHYRQFPEYLHNPAEIIMDTLQDAYIKVFDDTPKRQALIKVMRENLGKKICIVVPKAYYVSLIKHFVLGYTTTITTVNKFDNTQLYDLIISVGNIAGRKFDIFRCKSAKDIMVFLYEAEIRQYRRRRIAAANAEHLLNQRSSILVEDEEYNELLQERPEDDAVEIDQVDDSINAFIGSSMARTARTYFGGNNRNTTTKIIAVAKFDSDEFAFFTKNYKAYVIDQDSQMAREEKVEALTEGDTIVFTRSTSKTRDIVDEILQEMVNQRRLPQELIEAYRLSKLWRIKLIDYMNDMSLSPGKIAKRMINNGARVQEVTIKGWLDEDSHTVGPREMNSIEQIASIIGDADMLKNASIYFQACADIRKIRRQILEAIGRATLTRLTGNELRKDSILATVQEKINDLAVVLTIESITFVKEEVPTYMINRPVSIGTE